MLRAMKLARILLVLALSCLVFAGCSQSPGASEQLAQLLDEYVEEYLRDKPVKATYLGDNRYNDRFDAPISAERQKHKQVRQAYWLARLGEIDPGELTASERLSWQTFELDRQTELAGFDHPRHYFPLDQFNGMHIAFPASASGDSIQPFATPQDYANFIGRAQEFATWLDSTILAMREGAAKGYTLPRHIVQKMLPQLRAQIVDTPQDSSFYLAVKKMPRSFSDAERARIEKQYQRLITDVLVPAYARVLEFLEKEYLPLARESVGYSSLPNGAAWYAREIARHTTLPLSPREVHETGLAEVARIRAEMAVVAKTVGFEGDLQAFFQALKTEDRFYFESEDELLAVYRGTAARIDEALPRLFDVAPRADWEIRPVEAFRAASSAGASYQSAAPDGSRPGIFYINTYNLKAQPRSGVETLILHEALPGHYFQGELQSENESLPLYRRYFHHTVYSEGWGLYAESLGRELGLFEDPYQWYGRLNDEQLRAMRLVVDSGMHAMGWSRQQAIDFMLENSSLARSDIEAEVDRYIVYPGQALSYKIGDIRLQQLRAEAEAELGEDFDIRAFHRQLLMDGSLPMPVLEQKVRAWIKSWRR